MKNLRSCILGILFIATAANAQAVKVDKKYGVANPTWAKTAPATVQYYYLPDIETYYDAPAKTYIYQNNGAWVRTKELPARYKGYNLNTSRPVYLTNYKGQTPYVLFKEHKVKYKGNGWKRNGHDNGLHKGHNKGKGKGKK
jgi:hypothetical protein